ncbi:MAG TPA: hypothetical protein DCL44_09175 [Elusimicrobia bacterium]|nr:hypothetical protein [Elusimicrobiota bacterium]
MKKLIIAATLAAWPLAFAGAQDGDVDYGDNPPEFSSEPKEESAGPVHRPDAQEIIIGLSSLNLSSNQEERLNAAINKKAQDFDKLMEGYEENSAEEKKWRLKVTEQRRKLQRITQAIPEIIMETLDEEQRQGYEDILATKKNPAPKGAQAIAGKPAGRYKPAALKPAKKRQARKKRLPTPEEAAMAAPAEEAGSVMVDKEQGAAAPNVRKKRRIKKKKIMAPAQAPAPVEDVAPDESAVAQPTGQEFPASGEEDAGSYP